MFCLTSMKKKSVSSHYPRQGKEQGDSKLFFCGLVGCFDNLGRMKVERSVLIDANS